MMCSSCVPRRNHLACFGFCEPLSSRQYLCFATRSSVERVARLLRSEQFHVAPLHGGQSQGYRTQALRAFRAGYVDVLVATDLASRGLDLPDIEHVVLFDMPRTIEDYVHRCGRTGRHPGGDTGGADVSGKLPRS